MNSLRRTGATFSWNTAGQFSAAFFGLLLVKASVSAFTPSAYGLAALVLGIQLLLRNIGVLPTLNLALYGSSSEGAQHGLGHLYALGQRALLTVAALALLLVPVLLRAAAGASSDLIAYSLLIGALLASEALKSLRFNLLHCRGMARRYALWFAADAAVKPLMVYAAGQLGASPGSTLLLVMAQVAGSLLPLAASYLDPQIQALSRERLDQAALPGLLAWLKAHRGFLSPLLGVGLTGWITGLSDRYLVNHFLGAGPAGLYAGVYGLFSAPFLICGGAVLLTARPALLQLQAEGRTAEMRALHLRVLGLMALGAAGLAALLYALRDPLIGWVLAPAYREARIVVPGLLLGNAILALGTFLEQAFYFERRTSRVLLKQAVGSACALVFVSLALPHWGLVGAGWACPGYAGMEFLAGALLLNRARGTR